MAAAMPGFSLSTARSSLGTLQARLREGRAGRQCRGNSAAAGTLKTPLRRTVHTHVIPTRRGCKQARRRVQVYNSTITNTAAATSAPTGDGEQGGAGSSHKAAVRKLSLGWTVGDKLDRRILALWIPAILNFIIIPLSSATDVFWVGRLGDAVALASQGAANQVFSAMFWIISFLPSLVTPLVAKAAAKGDQDELQTRVGEAIFLASIIGTFGMVFVSLFSQHVLGLVAVSPGTGTFELAQPYLLIRCLTFMPAVVSTVAFATFRGTVDVVTPLKITLFANLVNVALDPLLIFGGWWIPAMGVAGAALATVIADLTSAASYLTLLVRRKFLLWSKVFRYA
eukprot:scaffold1414_cov384-Prasinococcus_capsulatus_cf.AAC.17